jgi:two-component system response regulator GlrR
MTKGKILLVDDDKNILKTIKKRLEIEGYDTRTAISAEEALKLTDKEIFDLVVTDLRLASADGISLMEELHRIYPDLPIIILTAYGSIENAVEAMQKGAYSYLTKPYAPRDLLLHISKALEKHELIREVKQLKSIIQLKHSCQEIVGNSLAIQKVLQQISRIAQTDSTVCIYGESGTGKELVAQAIHGASKRADKPFVTLNCAAIPESLLENELFGHVKGAYTGAHETTKGIFSQAHGGTLFLDEISEIPLSMQSKLLRVLQDQEFYPVGAAKPCKVDVRIIVATNKDLEKEVANKAFREDLYYRIHVIPLYIPPLRERKEDIPLLASHFLRKYSQKLGKEVTGIAPEVMQRLMLYHWPGNIRELENTIEYAVAMTTQNLISLDCLRLEPKLTTTTTVPKTFKQAKEEFERNYLEHILILTKGNVSKAAQLSGKFRADLYHLIKKYGLKVKNYKRKNGE